MERGLERREFANLHLSSDSISRPKTEKIYRCELTARVRDAPDIAGRRLPSIDGRTDGRMVKEELFRWELAQAAHNVEKIMLRVAVELSGIRAP